MPTNIVPRFPEPLPSKTQNVEDFNNSMFGMAGNLNAFCDGANAAADFISSEVANVNANVEALANLVWVSGTNYTTGQVRWSPADFGSYRRKTNGGGTIDPSNDPTNWADSNKSAFGGAELPVSATDITLTSLSSRFQAVTMTAPGMRVNLPSTESLGKGAVVFALKNIGSYRFHAAKSDTSFICFVEPGQTVFLNLASSATAAGKWHVFGQNLQNIYDLNAPIQLFNAASSTFDVVALTSTKLLFVYRKDSNSKLYARTINYGGTLGAETQIGTDSLYANSNISVDKLSSTQVIIAYKTSTHVARSVVVDVAADTITTGGTVDVDAATTSSFHQIKIVSVTTTKAICYWLTSASSYIYFRPITITGNTPAVGATVPTTLQVARFTVKKLTATKLLLIHGYGSNANVGLQLMSDTALTGTSIYSSSTFTGATNSSFSYCVINSNLGMLVNAANTYSDMIYLNLVDTSGLTPSVIKPIKLDVNLITNAVTPSIALIDTNTMYLSWHNGLSYDASGVALQLTSDNSLRFGVISQGLETKINALSDSLLNIPIDATTVLQFARKTTPEIVYKTLRIADISDSNQIATASASSILLGPGPGGGNGTDGNTAFIRYATDAAGTGFTDIPGNNSHVAIVSLPPDTIPTIDDFAGQWHKWNGPPGNGIIYGDVDPTFEIGNPGDSYVNTTSTTIWWNKSSDPAVGWGTGVNLKGDQGLTGGFNYSLGASTVAANPGPGWMRFNSTTFGLTTLTEFYVSSTTKQGQNVIDILASLNVDDSLMYQPATTGTEILYVSVIGVTANDAGAWYTISIEYKGGNSLTAFKEYTMNFAKVFGLNEVLQNKVLRRDTGNNIIDENGNIIGGVMSGTYATMAALSPAGYVREYCHVIDYGGNKGIRYFSNGTEWVADGKQRVYDDHPIFKAIFPNTQVTAVLNNGGKTQLTAVTHLLTAGVAVNATEPISVYISAWTGTGTAGWYKILSVEDVDKYTIDLNYNAANGTPTVVLKNTQVNTPITFSLPPLNNYSKFEIEYIFEFTASTTGKNVITKLGATTFSQITTNATGITLSGAKVGFRNISAKNKQESISGISTLEPEGNTTSAIVKMTEDTSVSSTITVVVSAVTANEVVGVRHITCYLEG